MFYTLCNVEQGGSRAMNGKVSYPFLWVPIQGLGGMRGREATP